MYCTISAICSLLKLWNTVNTLYRTKSINNDELYKCCMDELQSYYQSKVYGIKGTVQRDGSGRIIGSFDRYLLKRKTRRSRKILPSPILWESFKDFAPSHSVIVVYSISILISNSAHSSSCAFYIVQGLASALRTSSESNLNGAMNFFCHLSFINRNSHDECSAPLAG